MRLSLHERENPVRSLTIKCDRSTLWSARDDISRLRMALLPQPKDSSVSPRLALSRRPTSVIATFRRPPIQSLYAARSRRCQTALGEHAPSSRMVTPASHRRPTCRGPDSSLRRRSGSSPRWRASVLHLRSWVRWRGSTAPIQRGFITRILVLWRSSSGMRIISSDQAAHRRAPCDDRPVGSPIVPQSFFATARPRDRRIPALRRFLH